MQLLFALNVAYFFMHYQLPTAKSVSLYSGLLLVIVNFLGCGMGLIPDVAVQSRHSSAPFALRNGKNSIFAPGGGGCWEWHAN